MGLCLLAVAMACHLPAARGAPSIAVIAHPQLAAPPALRSDLARVFKRRQRITEAKEPLVPVNLPPEHPLRRAMAEILFHRSPRDMGPYWDQQYFHGVLPPKVVGSQEAMLRFVHETRGAIGYVADCRVDPRVQVIARFPPPTALAGAVSALCDGAH